MTSMINNIGYSIDSWCCRHSEQITSTINVLGVIFWAAFLAGCVFFTGFLARDMWVKEIESAFEWFFYSSWIIVCIAGACFSVYMAVRCVKAIKKHGWRTSW